MTEVQRVLLELDTDYAGHPYYVTGRALHAGIARRVDEETARALAVSMGVLTPGDWGRFPAGHSQSGGRHLGLKFHPVERYEDVFLYRDPAQRWLLDKRPRDAHNTHPVHTYGGRVAFGASERFGRPAESAFDYRSISWDVQASLNSDGDVLPVADDVLDGVRVGGARNYGFGATSLVDTQTVWLDALDYSGVRAADGYVIELVTPYVLATDHPAGDAQSVPWWWGAARDELRERQAQLVVGSDAYQLTVIDHGQVVAYTGDRPVETAKNGITRVGTHAKYGFGEFRVRPAARDRVPERGSSALGVGVDGE